MSVDLSTTYLGLKLKNPLVIAASPMTQKLDSLITLEEKGAAAAVFPSLFEEQIEHDSLEMTKLHEFGTRQLCRGPLVFPRGRRLSRRPGELPGGHHQGQAVGDDSDHRQPQRHEQRRLGPLCEDDARRRGRRPGVEHLLHRHRPEHERPRRRGPLCRSRGRGQAVGLDSAGREGRAVLQLDGQHGQAAGRGRGRRPRALQPLPAARLRSGDAGDEAQARLEHALRDVAAAPLDRHPARAVARPRWP